MDKIFEELAKYKGEFVIKYSGEIRTRPIEEENIDDDFWHYEFCPLAYLLYKRGKLITNGNVFYQPELGTLEEIYSIVYAADNLTYHDHNIRQKLLKVCI